MSTEEPNMIDNSIPDRPQMEPLSPEEIERFLARARVEGRALTAEEQYALFGPRPEAPPPEPAYETVEEMAPAMLGEQELTQLAANFFPEFGHSSPLPSQRLIQGIIFDFDNTLATLTRPIDELMAEGAKSAEAYMRSAGMDDLPADFWHNIIEARRFAQEKSEEEAEEHIADDAMSFLVQFFGYPASKMDPDVLRRSVDIFYAPEMMAWRLQPGLLETLKQLHAQKYKLAILANYNCDRVFQRTIDYLGLRPYLDVVLTSAAVEYRKPDERFFQLVLERWDALPYEVVVVGDSLLHDIKGGIDLGMLTVQTTFPTAPQVLHDNAQVAEQVVADAVLDEWHDFVELVRGWTE